MSSTVASPLGAMEARVAQLERQLLTQARVRPSVARPLSPEETEPVEGEVAPAPVEEAVIPDTTRAVPTLPEVPPLTTQVAALLAKSQQHLHQRQVLQAFWRKYETHRSLFEGDSLETTTRDISLGAKAEVVLAAEADLHQLLQALEESQALASHINPTSFQETDTLIPVLAEVTMNHEGQVKESMAHRAQVTALLGAYNNQINALSELFLHWDAMLNTVEAKVVTLERKATA